MIKMNPQTQPKMDRRASSTSESSVEAMDLGRTPNQTINNASKNIELSAANSINNDSDIYDETDNEDTEHLIRGDNKRSIVNIINDHHHHPPITNLRKKFRSSTPNRNNNSIHNNNNNNSLTFIAKTANDTTATTTTTIHNHHTDRTNNESNFLDASGHHLNSSPESGIGDRDDVKYVCPICEVVSATPHEFTNHIRCHNYSSGDSENFTCRICSKVLSSASSLDRHVLVHTGERPFNCKYCHLTFTTNGNMHRHMRTHKQHPQQRNNSSIGSGGGSSGPGSGGSGNGDGESYESDGGCSTDSSTSSANNNNNNNNNSYKRKSTDDDSGIIKRRMKTTINNNIISETEIEHNTMQKYCCPVCNRNDFLNMLALGTHMDREHPGIPAKCRQCEIVFKSHKSLNAHRCLNKLNITQGFKDITFVDFSSEKFPLIAKSLCEQTIRTPITNQKFECPKCYRAFPCASAVEIHTKDCGDSPQDYSIRKRVSSESSDEENRRDEFFAHLDLRNKSAMSLASTMSSPRTSEKSDIKGDLEKTPRSLYYHNESKDLADIQSILNVTSSSSSFLKNFEKAVNTPSSDYGLGKDEEEAQDAFTSEFRKMKLRGEFPCKLCTAVFPNLRALKGHNRVHLSAAGAGPYRCNMCPYSIHDKAALIRHMRTHNGDRPYECAVCNYAFTTKANCERHLRNRHAKTTREEVKRAIIYHPSEDSSCEDPIKKLHLFSSPEFDQDDEQSLPKDRSTPVSHLKEMLQSDKPLKIQVKSLEKLIDKSSSSANTFEDSDKDDPEIPAEPNRPIDLSMDVLDLSKKAKTPVSVSAEKDDIKEEPKIDMSMLEKNHQWFLANQQLFSEAFPKIDTAQYLHFSQLYQNLVFPRFSPIFFPNTFLPSNLNDLKFPPSMLLNPMFQTNDSQTVPTIPSQPNTNQPPQLPNKSAETPIQNSTSSQILQKSLTTPSAASPQLNIPRHSLAVQQQSQPNMMQQSQNSGPVKMVIKNGVLMPKQKQRRYRTERPFTCEHCAARFTLRSNMERHVKQQHPQYWAQRQRTGHHIMRRGGSVMSQVTSTSVSSSAPAMTTNHFGSISEQVKFAILAQQLKGRKDPDILQQALAQTTPNNNNTNLHGSNHNISTNQTPNNSTANVEDDDPKLIIDEEDIEDDDEEVYDETKPEDLSKPADTSSNLAAKKVAETILEQAIKASSSSSAAKLTAPQNDIHETKDFCRKVANNMQVLKEVASSSFKDESSDLVPVSKLIDNATNPLSSFNNYFRPSSDIASQMEQSDEEGLVASGSASESNNSGTEDPQGSSNIRDQKRKSAYSLAPNRVSCPYCQRMFPWSSSLRRHILTHTGQKPFKCSHCPLLFTTKSNCDRHLLRKHGNVESAVSLYVPIEDIPDPVPTPKPEELEQPKHTNNNINLNVPTIKTESLITASDLPFKCHLCDNSFAERTQCLEHIKSSHAQEFALLLAKGAIDADADYNQMHSAEDDDRIDGRGKYPDYANRKVMCAFCMRRFWSTEDLRRHMRTHSGERPFQCEICLRKFTLKHSMLRHMKKHSNGHHNNQSNNLNSGSDMSDDEQSPPSIMHTNNPVLNHHIQSMINKTAGVWKNSHKENISQQSSLIKLEKDGEENSDLIGNLLGISDQGILNKLLSSADEAAKLLGVEK